MPKQAKIVDINFMPRPLQLWTMQHEKRFNVEAFHRRFGKTVMKIGKLIDRGLRNPLRDPKYSYIAPFRNQAKKIAWDYLKNYTANIPGNKPNEADLSVTIPRPNNQNFRMALPHEWQKANHLGHIADGSIGDKVTIELAGADNPDAIRGVYRDGVVLDEYAQISPELWGQSIRPLLSDRLGWADFIGTPKGQNHFFDLYEKVGQFEEEVRRFMARTDFPEIKRLAAGYIFKERRGMEISAPEKEAYNMFISLKSKADWWRKTFKASETNIIPKAELLAAKTELSADEYNQEYECDWNAAVKGTYYYEYIKKAEDEGRVTTVPWNPDIPVDTYWDLGMNDVTAIWFRQRVGQEWRYIDYEENNGVGLEFYAKLLREKPYVYGRHVLPHDAKVREMGTGVSRVETLQNLGIYAEVQKRQAINDRINASRTVLPKAWFDKVKCARGLRALKQYQRKWDEVTQTFSQKPLHDWSSNGSDSFGYSALDEGSRDFMDYADLPTHAEHEYDMFNY